jgi:hypothetical protein
MALFPLGILSAAGAGVVAGDYELISTEILGSAQSSITFSSLGTYSSIYKHLQIRAVARKSDTSNEQRITFNGDTGSNYALHYLYGNGTSVQSGGGSSNSFIANYPFAGSNFTADAFGAYVMDILDPYSTTKNTTIRQLSALSNVEIQLSSGFWNNTASITSISLTTGSGNLVAGSRFSIYGIRG